MFMFGSFQWLGRVSKHYVSISAGLLRQHAAIFATWSPFCSELCYSDHCQCLCTPWGRINTIFHLFALFRWCHHNTWPVVGCSSYSSCSWSFVSPLLGLCNPSTRQNAQPRALLPTYWSLQVTGACKPFQSSIPCTGPLRSGPNL